VEACPLTLLFVKKMKAKTIFLVCGVVLAGLAAAGYYWLFAGLPSLDALPQGLAAPSLRITDRNGKLLYDSIAAEGGRNIPIPLASIPLALQQATISTEDNTFYQNPGVDVMGILRALWIDLHGGETLAGGSTITQQVARTLLLQPEERSQRSLRRKLRESILAWQLARRYPKDKILELYLNQTYYGAFSYGVEAAAQTFFNKHATDLDLAECALLAGLPQSPGTYNPLANPQAGKQRQGVVLGLMEKHNQITSAERELAAQETLEYASIPYPIEAPHFVMMVEAQLEQILPPDLLHTHTSLTVRTTLDLDWQHQAEAIAVHQLDILNHPPDGSVGHNVHNAALVALDPRTGEILALLGSPDYFDASISGAINMAISPAQPGSALKPVIYAAAFDPKQADPWTAATMILDVRTAFSTHAGEPYVPVNYDQKEHGPVSARAALASSLNIPAVKTLNKVGLVQAIQLASKLGITTFEDPNQYDLSLALGGGAVRLLELTSAYAAFDNGGYKATPHAILDVTAADGSVLYKPQPAAAMQVLDERVAWLVTNILSDDSARAIGFGLNSALNLDRPAAAKTGTTTNFHDNWTIGYTPDLVVGVWVGNANYQPMRDVTGLTGAGPIWHQFMRTVLSGRPKTPFPPAPGLNQVEVCALSGMLPSPACPYLKSEWFIPGTEPKQTDSLYKRVTLDVSTGKLAGPGTLPGQTVEKVVLDLPLEAQPWAHSQGLTLLSDVENTPPAASATQAALSLPLQLVSPDPNATFRLAADLPADQQKIAIQAVGEAGLSQVTLWVDGSLIASMASAPYQAWWTLTTGSHQAWAQAVRTNGDKVTSPVVSFMVK
jgi:penicillin-binding protein 1C